MAERDDLVAQRDARLDEASFGGPEVLDMERDDASDERGPEPSGIEEAPAGALGEADPTEEPTTPPALADFEGLEHLYGDHHALGPVTLSLQGDCIGLLGPNGAGKSTLLRIMMGLLRPTQGEVYVLGRPVRAGSTDLRRRIGYVPEGHARFPGLSGIESVAYAGRLVGMSRTDALQRAHQVLDYVGLGEARYRAVDTYSTGMRQRLKIAQGLVHDPEILVLDEPTEGVDPQAREEILSLISELVREHGLKLILSTHLLHDVERVATHALILNEGRVVQHGALEELRTRSDRGHQVRLAGSHEVFEARLRDAGIDFDWVPPDLRVRVDDPRVILRLAEEAGVVVRHLSPVEISLDEAFEEALSRGAASTGLGPQWEDSATEPEQEPHPEVV